MSDLIHELPLSEIWENEEFNSRGHIQDLDVVELSRSIQQHGLLQPITVFPLKGNENPPPGKKYQILAGHRRYRAHKLIDGQITIRAIIDTDAKPKERKILNAIENIQRKDLDISQEAEIVADYHSRGWTIKEIADSLNKYPRWVEVRLKLSRAPDCIKKEAAAGVYTQDQVDKIVSFKQAEKQIEAAKIIKEAKEKFGSRIQAKLPDEKPKPVKPKTREELLRAVEQLVAFDDPRLNDVILALQWAASVADAERFNEMCRRIRGS